MNTRRPSEAPRDQLESSFTPILRRLWEAAPSLLSAAFVDLEGECIDYVSAIPPFEAKVSAAHALVLMDNLRGVRHKLGLSEPVALTIGASERELWARRVSDEYLLVAVVAPGDEQAPIDAALAVAGREFREEVGVPTPSWEPRAPELEVSVRPAVGWPFAPASFTQDGKRVGIADVLGRWEEASDANALVCFRVRTEAGQELTLVHDSWRGFWLLRI